MAISFIRDPYSAKSPDGLQGNNLKHPAEKSKSAPNEQASLNPF